MSTEETMSKRCAATFLVLLCGLGPASAAETLHEKAARVGGARVELAARLVTAGAEVDARTSGGATPLHVAAYWGAPTLADWLIAHGADVHARNDLGETPLVIAVRACRPARENVIEAAVERSIRNAES